jgi:hypothetical protein
MVKKKRTVVSSRITRTGEEDRIFDVIIQEKVLVDPANHTVFRKKRVVATIIKNMQTRPLEWLPTFKEDILGKAESHRDSFTEFTR